jgi:hypothetical protein
VRPEPSFEEADRIQKFWEDNYQALLCEYPEHFVAVKDGKVVAADPDLARLFYMLTDLGLDPRTGVAIEFISAHSSALLL